MRRSTRIQLEETFDAAFISAFPDFVHCETGSSKGNWRSYSKPITGSNTLFLLLQHSRNDDRFTIELAITGGKHYPFDAKLSAGTELSELNALRSDESLCIRFRIGAFVAEQGDFWWWAAKDELIEWDNLGLQHSNTASEFVDLNDSVHQAIELLQGPVRGFLHKSGVYLD